MMLEDFLINSAIGTLLLTVKNRKRKKELRAAFLKVFLAIKAAYAGDEDFQ